MNARFLRVAVGRAQGWRKWRSGQYVLCADRLRRDRTSWSYHDANGHLIDFIKDREEVAQMLVDAEEKP